MGLLLSHKRTLSVYPDMLVISAPGGREKVGGGKRGEITEFSRESRKRLFQVMHSITFEKVSFVTLTYPENYPLDFRIHKAQLKEYRRRYERQCGPVRAIWRLEFQKRGAPHYHIMYFDAPFFWIKTWCAMWSDVIHTDDENHRKNGVDLKVETDSSQQALIAAYVGKYIGKVSDEVVDGDNSESGRRWGYWNFKPESPITVEVSYNEAVDVCNDVLGVRRGNRAWEPADPSVCTVFGGSMGSTRFEHAVLESVKNRASERRKKRD